MARQSGRVRINENARLMRKVAAGNFGTFERLYDRFAPILMHFFVRHGVDLSLAGDLTQKVFIHLWERRKDYRPDSSFESYLFSIAKHSLSKEIRESRRAAETGLKGRAELIGDSHDGLSDPELELYLKQLAAAVERAKGKLSVEERQALSVAESGNIPFSIAAQKLACSQEALKKRLQRARRRMRELLAPILDDEIGPARRQPRRRKS